VADVTDITPGMRRIQLQSPALEHFEYLPGQDLSLGFTRADGSLVRRRYTIRRLDRERGRLDLDVVMHGDGPGMRWAQGARPGTSIEAIGPRGKITLVRDAEWHLFAGDATAVPGAFAFMEALPDDVAARAFLQVDGPHEHQPFDAHGADRRITWSDEAPVFVDAGAGLINAVSTAENPGGRGHAYLAGEVALVQRLKALLLSRGWRAEQISAKAYWNRGRANAGHGEPEQKA
jgi:NADPH-dependent ferric siderophore reductase